MDYDQSSLESRCNVPQPNDDSLVTPPGADAMVFGMVDAIVRSKGKRGAAMLGGYRGYLIMAPRDLFPSIAQHRVQAVPPTPLVPYPGMPPQHMLMPGWPPFMWGGLPPGGHPPQVAPGQAPPPDLLQQLYPHLHAMLPTPQPPVPVPAQVAVPHPSASSPVEAGGAQGEDPEAIFDAFIMSNLKGVTAKRAPAPTLKVSTSPSSQAEAGDHAAVETPTDARPERTTLAPAAPSPTPPRSRQVRGSRRSWSRSRSPAAASSRRRYRRSASRSRSRSRSRERERNRDREREREGEVGRGRETGGWGHYGPQPVAGGWQRSEPRRGDREGKAPSARRSRSRSRNRDRNGERGRGQSPEAWSPTRGGGNDQLAGGDDAAAITKRQLESCYEPKVRARMRSDPPPGLTFSFC
jgi:hypothetical protein